MDLFFQVFVNSLVIGSLYGAIAMSFALAYRTTRFFNLAHGSMAAIGGYTFFWMRDSLGAAPTSAASSDTEVTSLPRGPKWPGTVCA